ncbi:unnamed protein product, partial [Urochloa humidicola]
RLGCLNGSTPFPICSAPRRRPPQRRAQLCPTPRLRHRLRVVGEGHLTPPEGGAAGAMDRVGGGEKQLEDCTVANALGTWFFSVAGALVAIPVGIKKKSLAPLVFFGTTGTMLDIIMGISQCEREHAERQMKLLEAQKLSVDASTGSESA